LLNETTATFNGVETHAYLASIAY